MTHTVEYIRTTQDINDTCTTVKSVYSRQSSMKRTNCQNEKEMDIDEIAKKRTRSIMEDRIPCPLADFGCLSDIPRDNLEDHYRSRIHNECLMENVLLLVKKFDAGHKTGYDQLNNEENMSEIDDSLNLLAEGLSSLDDDHQRLNNEVLNIRNLTGQQNNAIQELKRSVEESNNIFNTTQMTMQILETEIESLKQMTMGLSAQSSNDGTFLWKITDVAEKITDAVSDRQTSIYSPPFYSSPTGYKMCMRLYFNGDATGRGTHLSLFFVLMRGDYDAILSWPFCFKVTFCLFDQTTNQEHIIDTFRPDIKSNSFQRPTTNMNIASGLPKFCPLPKITQTNSPYVRDNCMFIRCVVDFYSVPKPVVSYICRMNVGLPKAIQNQMIKEEMERHKVQEQSISQEKKTITTDKKLE